MIVDVGTTQQSFSAGWIPLGTVANSYVPANIAAVAMAGYGKGWSGNITEAQITTSKVLQVFCQENGNISLYARFIYLIG